MRVELHGEQQDVLKTVAQIVLNYLQLDKFEIKSRQREYVQQRWLYFAMARRYTSYGLGKIGALIGKDHATVLHGLNALESDMRFDRKLQAKHEDLKIIFASEFVNKNKEEQLKSLIERMEIKLIKLKKDYEELTNPKLENQENWKEIQCEAVQLHDSGIEIPIR